MCGERVQYSNINVNSLNIKIVWMPKTFQIFNFSFFVAVWMTNATLTGLFLRASSDTHLYLASEHILNSSIHLASRRENSYRRNTPSPFAASRGILAKRPPGPTPLRCRSARWIAFAQERRASASLLVTSCPARRLASWYSSDRASWSRDIVPTRCRRPALPDICLSSRTNTVGFYRSWQCSCNSEDRRIVHTIVSNKHPSERANDRCRETKRLRSRPHREPVGCWEWVVFDENPVVLCRLLLPEPWPWKELRCPETRPINWIEKKVTQFFRNTLNIFRICSANVNVGWTQKSIEESRQYWLLKQLISNPLFLINTKKHDLFRWLKEIEIHNSH